MKECTCAVCGSPFQAKPNSKRQFCSSACYHQSRVTQVARNCERCGAVYMARPKRPSRFCSNACQGAAGRARVERACRHCGTRFVVVQSRAATANYCSQSCRAKALSPLLFPTVPELRPRDKRTCFQCGAAFEVLASRATKYCSQRCQFVSMRKSQQGACQHCGATFVAIPYTAKRQRFCSRSCTLAALQAQHAAKRPPSTKTKRKRPYDGAYRKVAKQVRIRDRHRCQKCGRQFVPGQRGLEVHHRVPVRKGIDHRPENLWCLCVSCHRKEDIALRIADGLPIPDRWHS